MKAKGILRHRFWGTYSAVIALEFESELHARDALEVLGTSWTSGEVWPQTLVWSGNSAELDALKIVLEGYGADAKKIDSVTKSVDFGEPFEVDIPPKNHTLPLPGLDCDCSEDKRHGNP